MPYVINVYVREKDWDNRPFENFERFSISGWLMNPRYIGEKYDGIACINKNMKPSFHDSSSYDERILITDCKKHLISVYDSEENANEALNYFIQLIEKRYPRLHANGVIQDYNEIMDYIDKDPKSSFEKKNSRDYYSSHMWCNYNY